MDCILTFEDFAFCGEKKPPSQELDGKQSSFQRYKWIIPQVFNFDHINIAILTFRKIFTKLHWQKEP
jgi:hypothetical protein